MRVGNFTLLIPEGREKDSGHVCLGHGQQYTIQLRNYWNDRACDAEVTIDGKSEGAYRINPNDSITLETPAHDSGHGRFTFFEAHTQNAKDLGVDAIHNEQRGVIQVRFKPEYKRVRTFVQDQEDWVPRSKRRPRPFDPPEWPRPSPKGPTLTPQSIMRGAEEKTAGGIQPCSMFADCEEKTSAGITGLTGYSNQRYVTVANLNYDPSEEVTITIRLVCAPNKPRPLTRVEPQSNPIPSPVE
jgi:hypothetical protein